MKANLMPYVFSRGHSKENGRMASQLSFCLNIVHDVSGKFGDIVLFQEKLQDASQGTLAGSL